MDGDSIIIRPVFHVGFTNAFTIPASILTLPPFPQFQHYLDNFIRLVNAAESRDGKPLYVANPGHRVRDD